MLKVIRLYDKYGNNIRLGETEEKGFIDLTVQEEGHYNPANAGILLNKENALEIVKFLTEFYDIKE